MIKQLIAASAVYASLQSPTEQFQHLVSKHIDAMFAAGYANVLDVEDINHGHMLVQRGKSDCYDGLDDLLSRVEVVLYHTQEGTSHWELQKVPECSKTPRSIAGLLSGRVVPAVSLTNGFLEQENTYHQFGTVFGTDITRAWPHLYDGSSQADNTCVIVDGERRDITFKFWIDVKGKVIFDYR